jgi:ribulose-phosphate 3-epimerase
MGPILEVMATIVPAILPTSRQDLDEKLARLVGIASEVQVDVVDGIFASPASWPYAIGTHELGHEIAAEESFLYTDNYRVEMDLMVREPESVIGSWIEAGATRVLVHVESTEDLSQLIANFSTTYGHQKGFAMDLLSLGLALNIATDASVLDPYIDMIDYVQFMGIKDIGKQGQPFATEVLNRIAVFRKRHPETPIQVDGGVNFESAPLLARAGVSRLVVGSALWKSANLKAAYEQLVALAEPKGLYE